MVWFPSRVVVIAGAILLLGAMLYGLTLNRGVPYFPNLVLPLLIGAIGLGLFNVPLALSMIASVGFDRIGPNFAITGMLRHQRAGGVHERRPVECARPRLHLRLAVAGRGGNPARRGWRCSSATPRNKWRRRRNSTNPSTPRNSSFTEVRPAALVAPPWRWPLSHRHEQARPRTLGSHEVTSTPSPRLPPANAVLASAPCLDEGPPCGSASWAQPASHRWR